MDSSVISYDLAYAYGPCKSAKRAKVWPCAHVHTLPTPGSHLMPLPSSLPPDAPTTREGMKRPVGAPIPVARVMNRKPSTKRTARAGM